MAEDDGIAKRKGYGLERTLALSDGVFAITVTLLVLDLAIPALSSEATSLDLWQALSNNYVGFINYTLSFFIAGLWWNAHHRNFEHIQSSTAPLRILNLVFLLWIALLPFFTKILDQFYSLQLSVVLYAIDQAVTGVVLAILWLYASNNHRLINKKVSKTAIRYGTYRNIIVPIFFIASIGLSFFGSNIATISWYAVFPVLLIVVRLEQRKLDQLAKQS